MRRLRMAAALAVGGLAFAIYHATLLPGLDLGDSASFQALAGESLITPRDGYPLYLAIGRLFVWLSAAEPARALNLASAVEGAVAAGLLVLVADEVSGSVAAAAAVGMLFAGSYTFWSQAIITEVYALHAVLLCVSLLLLLRWEKAPSEARLACFFAAYALGFGNHLSMALLAPAYVIFLALAAPGGWRGLVAPRVMALAVAAAIAGSLQYVWNLRALWLLPHPPSGIIEALGAFWFDVTKSDWRDTMVMRVAAGSLGDRLAMYAFDLNQQFGPGVPILATLGLARLFGTARRRAILLCVLYLANVAFAFSYNVGDAHVFYLPSHLFLAILAAPGLVCLSELATPLLARLGPRACRAALPTAACLAIVWAGDRMYVDYPSLDRSEDRRPADVLAHLAEGLHDRNGILLTDLDWQLENGLTYFAKVTRPDLAWARMSDVLLYAPALIRDNEAIGRQIALTERASANAAAAYGPWLSIVRDPRVSAPPISEFARDLPAGTRYVLTILRPTRDRILDRADVMRVASALSGGAVPALPPGDYAVIAGLTGRRPAWVHGAADPFHQRIALGDVPVEIRMEAWLAADTIRRMGFGHVVVARHHTLIVERGVSFVAFDAAGRPLRTGYASNIYEPLPRYLVGTANEPQ